MYTRRLDFWPSGYILPVNMDHKSQAQTHFVVTLVKCWCFFALFSLGDQPVAEGRPFPQAPKFCLILGCTAVRLGVADTICNIVLKMAFQLWKDRCPWQHRVSLLLLAKQYCVKEVHLQLNIL